MRRRIAAFLLIIPVAAAVAGFLWLRSSLPPAGGTVVVPGLSAPVRISRDAATGIPTIAAANDRDADFALGYVHAQDRLFQMDLMRHYAAGRLAEWFGPAALESDRTMRTLGLARVAERQFDALAPEVRAALEAYAAGVNAYLQSRRHALPLEYYLLRADPEPWRPTDALVWGRLMAWRLAGNYRSELVRARIAQHVKPEEMPVLYPAYPKDAPTVLGDLAPIYRSLPLDRLIALMPAFEDPPLASNNWVVSGARSISGKPLLANDPHLELTVPGTWYLARIVTPDGTRAGATVAGVPDVIVGHNDRIAWGFTNTGSDVSDLFIEKLDPADATKYVTPEGSQSFKLRVESIAVRGQAAVEITVRETRHGPVISDLAGIAANVAQPGYVLALQATYLMDGDRTSQAFYGINRARNWEQFRTALTAFGAPQQNIVYADVEGHIGFIAPARVPIRAKGDGWLPVPGWTGEYDWTGFVPYDALPTLRDPPEGRIVTANNKIVPDGYRYFFGRDWDAPYRARRIAKLLDERSQSPDTAAQIQRDTYSPIAEQLLPLMLTAPGTTPRARSAIERLTAWDRRMDKDKVEPLIFTAWLREFNRTVLADKLGTAFEDYWDLHAPVIVGILTEHTDWCDDRGTDVVEVCSEQLSNALNRALDELAKLYGENMDEWRWGRAHTAEFRHPVLSRIPVLDRIFALSIPADGGFDTINRGGTPIRNSAEPYRDVLAAGLRMIVDMADPSIARFMIVPGESGNPLSPHYNDFMRPWRDGEAWPLASDAPTVEVLTPP